MTMPKKDIFIPDNTASDIALARTTHLAIGAHQDDLEFFAFHGIAECFENEDKHFTGITCSDGSGSPRAGKIGRLSKKELVEMRCEEQRKAARIGKYNAMLQLGYLSDAIKTQSFAHDLQTLLEQCQADTVYIHNPFDRHPTHIACAIQCIHALKKLPQAIQPKQLYGCEVWRDLDWLPDKYRVALPCSTYLELQKKLTLVFQSQIAAGKRYDKAVMGRRFAHATFSDSHQVDQETGVTLAIDLRPLLEPTQLNLQTFMNEVMHAFQSSIQITDGEAYTPPS